MPLRRRRGDAEGCRGLLDGQPYEIAEFHQLGLLRLDADAETLHASLRGLRAALERSGGSLVILRRPADMAPLDAWGDLGDTQALMRAIKQQLDPRGTLNPARFAGGI